MHSSFYVKDITWKTDQYMSMLQHTNILYT